MKTPQETGTCLEILLAIFKVAGDRHSGQVQRIDQGCSWLNAWFSSEVRNRAEDQYDLVTC